MSRSLLFRSLAHFVQIARYCNRQNLPIDQWFEQYEAVLDRRRRRKTRSKELISFKNRSEKEIPQPSASGKTSDLKVAIVGAGIAGLACGYELKQHGILATLYEANTRVGGRCCSLRNYFPNQIVEGGGEFIDSHHKTMLNYAKTFHLELETVSTQLGDTYYYFEGQHHSIPTILNEFRELLENIQEDVQTLSKSPTADRHTDADALLDRINLLQYLETRNAGKLVKAFIDSSYSVEYGLDLQEQSCLNFLLLHRDRHPTDLELFQTFGDEHYQISGGNDRIAQRLAEELQDRIHLEQKLVKVQRNSHNRIELTFERDAQTVSAEYDIAVLAIPFSVLRHIELDRSLELPSWKQEAIHQLGYGTVSKLMIGFQERPWVKHDSNGHSYSDLPNHQASWEMNPTQATSRQAVIAHCLGGKRAAQLDIDQAQVEATHFLNDLDCIYPGAIAAASRSPQGDRLIQLAHWPEDPLSRGSYACYNPGQFTAIAGNEGKPIHNLYFVGEHANSFYEWQGFMEGAALSGVHAAQSILGRFNHT
jgi:monoamine oxidase